MPETAIVKRPRRLRREIIVALAVKLAALIAIYYLFFAPPARPPQDVASVAHAVLGPGVR